MLRYIIIHVRGRWDKLPLVVGFMCCRSVCTEDWPVGLVPLCLSVCAAFAYLCPLQASGC